MSPSAAAARDSAVDHCCRAAAAAAADYATEHGGRRPRPGKLCRETVSTVRHRLSLWGEVPECRSGSASPISQSAYTTLFESKHGSVVREPRRQHPRPPRRGPRRVPLDLGLVSASGQVQAPQSVSIKTQQKKRRSSGHGNLNHGTMTYWLEVQ